jgi:pimeloyl-ACP methyl ester carboxylesterase
MRGILCSLVVGAAFSLQASAATVDGLKIHSSTAGTARETIILVHGWTCDSTSWTAQVAPLSKTYRVVTLDLPGHGLSGSPADGRFSVDLFARAVEAVRAETKADKVVLVGHSMGAPVIRHYARLYPQHVAGLVAVDGPRGMFTPQTPAALQQQVLAMMLKAPESTAVGAIAAMGDPELWKEDVVASPVLAIYAGTAKVPDVKSAQKTLPKFEATQIAGTGHFLMMEKPEEFNRMLTAFLAKVTF